MGSCNFGAVWNGIGGSYGLVPEYPSDEEIQEAKREYDWEDETDETVGTWLMNDRQVFNAEDYTYYKDAFEDRYQTVVKALWQFQDWDHPFPYECVIETGYYDGWRTILESRYFASNQADDTEWVAWCDLVGRWSTDPEVFEAWSPNRPHVPFENYVKHLRKVSDAVVWAFEELARQDGLGGVSGGRTGGQYARTEEDYTPIDHREKWEEMFPQFVNKNRRVNYTTV